MVLGIGVGLIDTQALWLEPSPEFAAPGTPAASMDATHSGSAPSTPLRLLWPSRLGPQPPQTPPSSGRAQATAASVPCAGLTPQARRPSWLVAEVPLQQLGLRDTPGDWQTYLRYLETLAGDPEEQQHQAFDQLSSGWAIGTIGWKRALAREYAHLQLDVGLSAGGVRKLNEARWSDALAKALRDSGRTESDLEPTPQPAPWKIEVAATLRREAAAPFDWIARRLKIGNLNTLRSKVRRSRELHPALA